MRKSIFTIAAALALASGSALAVNTHVDGGSVGGATVSSNASAVSGGNGSAFTVTGGTQQSINGFSGNASGSYIFRKGEATVSGVAGAQGSAFSRTVTTGAGAASSETVGKSFGVTGGHAGFDTHGSNPEGHVSGGAFAKNGNRAETGSAGNGSAYKWNESGTVATFRAHAEGDRDGGYFGYPLTDTVATEAKATSESYEDGGSGRTGFFSYRSGGSYTFGGANADAWAKSGNTVSND